MTALMAKHAFKMEILIDNKLPDGLQLECVSEFKDMSDMLIDEGVDRLVQPFYGRVLEEAHKPERKGQSWQMWEGYYVDQEDGSQNLYVVGVLFHEIFYSRAMRVKNVPRAQQTEVEKGLADMMLDYLSQLLAHKERTIKPGSGKTDQFPSGLN